MYIFFHCIQGKMNNVFIGCMDTDRKSMYNPHQRGD